MNGRKSKALRMLASYSVTRDRPNLPAGGWNVRTNGTCVLPKTHPRHKYQFLKTQYCMVPLAHTLPRMHNSTKLVKALDGHIVAKEDAA